MSRAVLLAVFSSVCFSLTYIFSRIGALGASSMLGGFISSVVVTVLFLPWIAATVPVSAFKDPQLLWFVGLGIFMPGLVRAIQVEGIKRIGAAPSGILRGLAPFVSTTMAVILLGERPSLRVAAGTCAIIAGLVVLSVRRGELRSWNLTGVVCGLLATFIWSVRDVVIRHAAPRVGYEGLAIFVMSATSMLAMGMGCLLADRGAFGRAARRGVVGFVLVGLASFGALITLFAALRHGEVVVVTPIVSTQPLFVLLFAPLLLRGMETVTRLMVLGALLIVLGGALIGMR
ncbi:MAG: DMT family transporter [Candidatus Tectomicrobia bacterium]|nr:DMT family transporter [Candidatus Tectomicrobia bacterium]